MPTWISDGLIALLHAVGALLAYLPDHPQLVIVIVTVLAAGWRKGQVTGSFRQGLLATMLRAEKAWNGGELGDISGPQVMDRVINYAETKLVSRLPADMRWYFTPDRIRRLAHYVYTDGQLLLNGGKLFEDGPEPPAPPQLSTPAPDLYSAALLTVDPKPKITAGGPAGTASTPALASAPVPPVTIASLSAPAPVITVGPVAAAIPDPSPLLVVTQQATASVQSPL